MSFLIVVGIFFASLFLIVYLTKRRLGLLGLALAAGSILASLWVGDLTPLVAQAGIEIVRPPLSSLVAAILIFLPVIILFFQGKTVKGQLWRIGSAAVFGVLAIALLLDPIGAALVVDEKSKPIYDFLVQYKSVIITAGLTLSIIDLMLGSSRRQKEPKH